MSKNMHWKTEDFKSYVEVTPLTDEKAHFAGDECWCNPVTNKTDGVPIISHNTFDNCKSYNKGYGELPEVILKAPGWSERKTICVDSCIADVIECLWDNGVVTLGSCCGHGKENPSVILGENVKNYEEVESLITGKDTRSWTLKQWQLVNVES